MRKMPQEFMGKNFLLPNKTAEKLYEEYAAPMPIFDYHAHLPISEILDDKIFKNITQAWLYGDHYKWRAMRACGESEDLVSGKPTAASDEERFNAWARVVPQTICNPLYHWTHLELRRYFGVNELLSPKTAKAIYTACSDKLKTPEFSVRSIIKRSNVKVICTTDNPLDDLAMHKKLAKEDWGVKVYPAYRPDIVLAGNDPDAFNTWIERLEALTDMWIQKPAELIEALWKRHNYFHDAGCRLSDYGIEQPYAAEYEEREIELAFRRLRAGKALVGEELEKLRSYLLYEMLAMDGKQGWTQQLHLGTIRNTNTLMKAQLGPDTGYDCMGDFEIGRPLVKLLNRLYWGNSLARTIIYVLNPRDNEMIASTLACFMDGETVGKIQFGTAWWFNDQKNGMERQMTALSSIGLLSRFIGMLTDSRSFLSYPRHEYFRRLLCAKLGTEAENGELPLDIELLGKTVQDVCFNNAANYFGLELPNGLTSEERAHAALNGSGASRK